MAAAVGMQPLAFQSQHQAPSTPASLLDLVFSAPLIPSVAKHLYLLRAVHRTPENALYKVRALGGRGAV